MIYLNPGTNSIVLTLQERVIGTVPYYTFKMVRKGTFEEKIFTSDDWSWAPWYWTGMTISVSKPEILTKGVVYLDPGEWDYTVYEMASKENLNISQSVAIVETGICIVGGTYSDTYEYKGTDNNTIKYYNNI